MMVFVIFGLIAGVIIWTLQRSRLNKAWRIAIITVLVIAEVILLRSPVTTGTLGEQEQHWYSRSPGREVIFFALMLCGMAARYVTGAIEARRRKIEELARTQTQFKKPGIDFDMWEFSYPVFVSVVTFGGLISQLQDQSLTVTNLILAFQTGFFWQTILAVRAPTARPEQTALH